MGFTDLTLGYHPSDANAVPQAKAALERYEQALSHLMGVARESRGGHLAYHTSTPTRSVQTYPKSLARCLN
jgi:hypothetical protein